MRFSLQVQYAIYGVFDLAYNGEGRPVQVRVIGDRQGIPMRYLEQIFQRLRRAELVTSKRGPGGGYSLSRPPREITLLDVVEAVEGPLGCAARSARRSEGGGGHRPDFLWAQIAHAFGRSLEAVTVESLCAEASRSAVRRANSDAHTYEI